MPRRRTSNVGVVNLLFFLTEESNRLRKSVLVRQFNLHNEFKPENLISLQEHLMGFRDLAANVAGTVLIFKRSGVRLPGMTKQLTVLWQEIRDCIAKGEAASSRGLTAKAWVEKDAKNVLVRVGAEFDGMALAAKKSIQQFVVGGERNHAGKNGVPARSSAKQRKRHS
jgi:hypothetical protein